MLCRARANAVRPFVRSALGRSQRSSPSPVPRCSAPFMLLLSLRLFGGGECTRVDVVHTVWCSFETASLQLAHWLVLCALTLKLSNDLVSSEGIRCLFSLCNSLACPDLCWVRSPSSQLFLFCQFSLCLLVRSQTARPSSVYLVIAQASSPKSVFAEQVLLDPSTVSAVLCICLLVVAHTLETTSCDTCSAPRPELQQACLCVCCQILIRSCLVLLSACSSLQTQSVIHSQWFTVRSSLSA